VTRIAILTPSLTDKDAVGNDVLGMYDALVRNGHETHLFASSWNVQEYCINPLGNINEVINQPDDLIIYHHSTGWDLGTNILQTLPCKKIVKYHNVTPSNFFEGINADYANSCRIGRDNLRTLANLANDINIYVSDSAYNAQEICELGVEFSKSLVLPPFHHISRLDETEANVEVIERFQDGKANLLMVGRIAPNKGHLALIQAFAAYYYGYNANSRLMIVGKEDERLKPYTDQLRATIKALGLNDAVVFTGGVSDADLKACYLVANLFVITSDHEGFCVPLIESMAMKLPIVAYASTAIPGTLDDVGVTWEECDPYLLAASIHHLITDESTCFHLAEKGWHRYQDIFTNQQIEEKFLKIVGDVLRSPAKSFQGFSNIQASPKELRKISTPEELDAEIARCEKLAAISADEFSRAVSEFQYVVEEPYPADPHSQEYFEFQYRLYREISGRDSYSIENEKSPFDLEWAKMYPYPYQTRSATIVGDQLLAQGFLIKMMNLSPGSSIVEFGPGWGNTTLHLLQMGYEVTAVDAEPNFLELIRHRAGSLEPNIKLMHQDMLEFNSEQKYDAALFFECFHHCSNHLQLLKKMYSLLTDNGLIAFAAEPITSFPYPWGLRLDGLSVYSIRKYGWLELGFDTHYFMQTLNQLGWTAQRYRSDISPIADVILARKR
jgi:glycosyltransferase involved in cell wall biosynthesis/2-polyprenyl-3-methyl-5-hydroxy-6-metoxy-1,4-benzoquinol methylase